MRSPTVTLRLANLLSSSQQTFPVSSGFENELCRSGSQKQSSRILGTIDVNRTEPRDNFTRIIRGEEDPHGRCISDGGRIEYDHTGDHTATPSRLTGTRPPRCTRVPYFTPAIAPEHYNAFVNQIAGKARRAALAIWSTRNSIADSKSFTKTLSHFRYSSVFGSNSREDKGHNPLIGAAGEFYVRWSCRIFRGMLIERPGFPVPQLTLPAQFFRKELVQHTAYGRSRFGALCWLDGSGEKGISRHHLDGQIWTPHKALPQLR